MSQDVPERPSNAALVEALSVRRNAAVGAAVGAALAATMYIVRVFELRGPVPGTREYPVLGEAGWFLVLAFVLAATTAMFVAALLTAVSAYRLSREL